MVTPGVGGHPEDRGRVEPLVDAALLSGDRATLLAICMMEVHYGTAGGWADTLKVGDGSMSDGGARHEMHPPKPHCADLPPCPYERWRVALSSQPWNEGRLSLQPFVSSLTWTTSESKTSLDTAGDTGTRAAGGSGCAWGGALPSCLRAADGREWQVFEAEGIESEIELRALLS